MTKISFGNNHDYLGYGLLVEVTACVGAIFYPVIFIPVALLGISLFLIKTEVQFDANQSRFRFVKTLPGIVNFGQWIGFNSANVYGLEKYQSATRMTMGIALRTDVQARSYTFTIESASGVKSEIYEFTDIQHAKVFREHFEKIFDVKIEVK